MPKYSHTLKEKFSSDAIAQRVETAEIEAYYARNPEPATATEQVPALAAYDTMFVLAADIMLGALRQAEQDPNTEQSGAA